MKGKRGKRSKKSKNGTKIWIIALVILILVAGGFLAYKIKTKIKITHDSIRRSKRNSRRTSTRGKSGTNI